VTDAGIAGLTAFTQLQALNLSSTKVTDAAVKALSALKELTTLQLEDTAVTNGAVQELQSELPNLRVLR
jgi:hypothetical protein